MPRLEVVYKAIGWFKPYERNPRKNDKAVDRIRASIKQFGFAVPILARSTGEVIDGHLRLKGAVAEKLAELPVILCDGWTDAQVKAFRLMVNRSVAWADWDLDALALEFADIKGLDFDLSMTGFDLEEIDGYLNGNAGNGLPDVELAKKTLAERFGVPPFSVLDARQGYWQDRKKAWLALGIKSELGRGGGTWRESQTGSPIDRQGRYDAR